MITPPTLPMHRLYDRNCGHNLLHTLAFQVFKQRDNVRAIFTYMMSEVPPVLPSCHAYVT